MKHQLYNKVRMYLHSPAAVGLESKSGERIALQHLGFPIFRIFTNGFLQMDFWLIFLLQKQHSDLLAPIKSSIIKLLKLIDHSVVTVSTWIASGIK